jgi:ribose 5-phosphate isomerase B
MNLLIGSDHAGFDLKADLREYLRELNISFADAGVNSPEPADYPDIAAAVAGKISSGEADRGILICGSGIGMCVVANRFPGVRGALCRDVYTAKMSREHNDSNLLILAGRLTDREPARQILKVWLETPFEGGRHQRRLDKLKEIEKKMARKG